MILNRLREATQELHTLLESKSMMNIFHTGDFSLKEYIVVLERFYQFLFPIEIQFNAMNIASYISNFESRRKLISLSNDLKQLQTDIPIEVNSCTTKIKNVDEAIGIIYVLEGSTLGGVQISKQLQTKLQIFPHNGGSFFYGYGKETGRMWKQFIEDLNKYSYSTLQEEDIVSGAVTAFRDLYNCLK